MRLRYAHKDDGYHIVQRTYRPFPWIFRRERLEMMRGKSDGVLMFWYHEDGSRVGIFLDVKLDSLIRAREWMGDDR